MEVQLVLFLKVLVENTIIMMHYFSVFSFLQQKIIDQVYQARLAVLLEATALASVRKLTFLHKCLIFKTSSS